MLFCRETGCLGWSLSPSDQYCSWCGAQLVEISLSLESKFGEEWAPLSPAVLNRERPPALRLRIAHEGEAGSFHLQASQLLCSAPWLGFDTSTINGIRLQPDEAAFLPVNRLKIPGKEDTFQDAKIQLLANPPHSGERIVVAKVVLTFVPPPRFQMELQTQEILLSSEGAPSIEGSLLLDRGRVWLEAPPRLVGDWATLELLDEDPEKPLRFPLELDGREKPRLDFRIHFGEEHVSDIRATGAENPTALRRNNKLVLTCRDRGLRGQGDTAAEALKIELPLQLSFVLAPEVRLEPFLTSSRRDWHVTLDGDDRRPLRLRVSNGLPGVGAQEGRQELVIRQLGLRVRQPEMEKCFSLEIPRPTPWHLTAGEAVDFGIRYHPRSGASATTLELVLVSNDPIPRSFFFDFRAVQPELFPGWLVIDLGTSNTCAALVDDNRKITLVPFDEEGRQMASAVCYLALRRKTDIEFGSRALQRSREPAATRAVVLAAKRRVGQPQNPFHVTPLDEPGETIPRTAEEVLQDLYSHVIRRATAVLLQHNRQDIILTRLAITHPSRFSVAQIGHLKQAANVALAQQLRRYPATLVEGGTASPSSSSPSRIPEDTQTLHEPIGAALHFLNDWRQQADLYEQWPERVEAPGQKLTYHLFVYDFGGGTLDMTLIRVQAQRQPLRNPEEAVHGFSYSVSPQVLGAMGERWFGGQDVTRELVELIRAGLTAPGVLLWPAENVEDPSGFRTRNEALLTAWAEELKIALVDGHAAEELLLSLPSLYFQEEGGKERLVSSSSLRRGLQLPSLEELQARIRPALRESLKRAARLIARHGLHAPDLVLQVGQACQLPAVGEALLEHFPSALQLRSQSPKSCVVLGAATTVFPGVSAGLQLSRGVDRPGLRLKLSREQSLSATTSRLGLKVLDGGTAWFQEILGEGLPIPVEGLQGMLEDVVLEKGPNHLTILENCGHRDELVLDERPNRDIQEIRQLRFEMSEDTEDCRLRFTIYQDLSLLTEIEELGVWRELARLAPQEFGGHY